MMFGCENESDCIQKLDMINGEIKYGIMARTLIEKEDRRKIPTLQEQEKARDIN